MPNEQSFPPADDAMRPESVAMVLGRIERQLDRIAHALEAMHPLAGDIRKDLGPTRTAPLQLSGNPRR